MVTRFFVVILGALLLFVSWTFAQPATATLEGTIRDQSGALMPGVAVTVVNTGTGAKRSVFTDERGFYRVPQLAIGVYEVKAEMLGFQTAVRTGIALTVGMQAVIDVELKVGEITEVLEVVGEAPLVQTTVSHISELVDAKTMRDLPLNGRNFVQLTTLQAGVVLSDLARSNRPEVTGTGMKINVNGTRDNMNSFLLDGQDIQDSFNTTPASGGGESLGVDTLQEFEVKTANHSAEYSKAAGAVISLATKSGTNDVHGSAFVFDRNDNLDARNFFDPEKLEFRRHQFGATIGGPIVRNKTFYFAGYEGVRESRSLTRRFVVPSLDARAGRLRNPQTGQVEQISVPASVRPYLDTLFPLPNGRDLGDGRAEHFARRANIKNQDFFVVKFDHRFSDADSLFVRYSFDDGRFNTPVGMIFGPSLPSRNQYLNLQLQKVFSPTVVNTLRGGYNRSNLIQKDVSIVNIPSNLFLVPGRDSMGLLNVGGLSPLGNSPTSPRKFILNVLDVSESLAITRGTQLIKFGGNVQRFQHNMFLGVFPFGQYSFGSLRSFLQGQAATFLASGPESDPTRGFRQTLVGSFAQDDIKLNDRLTLNLGVRWEFVTVPTEVNGKVSNLRSLQASERTLGNPWYDNPSLKNVAPRMGLAWDVLGTGRISVRSGFGIFYSHILPLQLTTVSSTNPPFVRNVFMRQPPFPNAFAVAGGQPPTHASFPFDVPQPTIYQWNLVIQSELPSRTVASFGYVGTRGIHLPRSISGQDANVAVHTIVDGSKFFPAGSPRRNPAFEEIRHIFYDANSFYHALQVSVRRRVGQGLQFQASYTYSKSIDEASGIFGGAADFIGSPGPQDILDHRSERGPSAFDQRHNFRANFSYDLPVKAAGGLGKLLNGWQVAGIVGLSTGFPFTVSVDGVIDRDRDLSTSSTRPDLVPGRSNNPILGNPRQWFDPTAFGLPAPGFYGNLGRNTLRAHGFANVDFSISKNISLSEKVNAEFRAEIFNLFNHPNFAVPSVRTIFVGGNPTPLADSGGVTATANPGREIQIGLKLIW